ncbi:hypothetical protein RSAG8_03681, partial [Rhizoctonia solani AG-8 WAC10335]
MVCTAPCPHPGLARFHSVTRSSSPVPPLPTPNDVLNSSFVSREDSPTPFVSRLDGTA